MSIELKLEKVLIGDQESFRIVSFDMLGEDQLPVTYFEDVPWCKKLNHEIFVLAGEDVYRQYLNIGGVYHKVCMEKYIRILKKSGERLHKINEELKKEKGEEKEEKKRARGWAGELTIVI